jgi:hypothetical protein
METEISVVFFVHFKSDLQESHRISRFNKEKTASDFFDWILENQKEIEKKFKTQIVVTNCGIIR